MKGFKFKMQQVLKLREFKEKQALATMLEAQKALEQAQRELNSLHDSIHSATRTQFETFHNGSEVLYPDFYQSFIEGQKYKIEGQKEKIRECQVVFEEKQDLYRKAAIELKALEKLKEKQREEYRRKKDKEMVKKTDDMISARFNRGQEL